MKRESLKEFIVVFKNPAWLCFVWTGVAVGVTLIAVPAIFGASTTDRADAIGVASAVFAARDRAEIAMLIALLILVRLTSARRSLLFPALGIALVVLLQSAWLLPILVERSVQIANGIMPDPSYAHAIYSTLEVLKILLLLFLAFTSMRVLTRA